MNKKQQFFVVITIVIFFQMKVSFCYMSDRLLFINQRSEKLKRELCFINPDNIINKIATLEWDKKYIENEREKDKDFYKQRIAFLEKELEERKEIEKQRALTQPPCFDVEETSVVQSVGCDEKSTPSESRPLPTFVLSSTQSDQEECWKSKYDREALQHRRLKRIIVGSVGLLTLGGSLYGLKRFFSKSS